MLRQLGLFDAHPVPADWRVRESRRARRLSVRVFRDGQVEIVVPRGTRPVTVAGFAARQRTWIERQRARLPAPEAAHFPPPRIDLTAIGEQWHCLVGSGTQATGLRIARMPEAGEPGEIELLGTQVDAALARAMLLRWLVVRMRATVAPLLEALARQMQCRYQRLQIRHQRTRWGSCSTRGTLSLNCCLLFQRPEVLRYLMVHELSHLRHMHHGERFWTHVARFEPDCRALDRELGQGWRRVPGWALRGRD